MTTFVSTQTRSASVYRTLLVVNLLAFAVVVVHRCVTPLPASEYIHRLVTYDDGLIRRGLVGEIYSWFTFQVSPWAVRLEGFLTIAFAGFLYALIFTRCYRLRLGETLALACFLFGSPLLFKNFVGNLAKFDVLGAIVAMVAVLLPLRRSSFILIGMAAALLLFVHHVHATIYLPTIYGILLVRSVGERGGLHPADLMWFAGSLALLALLFGWLLFGAAARVPVEAFLAAVNERALQPVPDRHAFMWYSTIAEEMRMSFAMFPEHLKRLPIYAAIVLIHVPLIGFFGRRIARLKATHPKAFHTYLGVGAVVLSGFLVTNVITFDYARHLGNLAVCFILISQAQILATTGPITSAEDLDHNDRRVIAAAMVAAALPWVGVVFPLV